MDGTWAGGYDAARHCKLLPDMIKACLAPLAGGARVRPHQAQVQALLPALTKLLYAVLTSSLLLSECQSCFLFQDCAISPDRYPGARRDSGFVVLSLTEASAVPTDSTSQNPPHDLLFRLDFSGTAENPAPERTWEEIPPPTDIDDLGPPPPFDSDMSDQVR